MFGKTGFWRMSEHAVVGNAIPYDPRLTSTPVAPVAYTSPFHPQFGMKPPELTVIVQQQPTYQQRVNYTSTMENPSNLRV
jgi:hypothetical protein